MSEQEAMSDEETQQTGRDLSQKSEWREGTDLCVLLDLNFYGAYLAGQSNGMSSSLPLPSVVAALEIEGVERNEWPERTARLLRIHGNIVDITEQRRRLATRGGRTRPRSTVG